MNMKTDVDPEKDPQALFQAAACGLLRTDATGAILLVNNRFCEWTGYSKDELVNTKRLQDLLTMGGRIFHQTHWNPLLQMQGSVSEVKLDVCHRNGQTMPMVLNAIRQQVNGEVVHDVAAFIARDRHKYEQELVNTTRRLRESISESDDLRKLATKRATIAEQMMGIVSHDLRNPLSTIEMSSYLLKKSRLAPDQLASVERITRAAEHSNRLISDLLDFTAIQLGSGIPVARKTCDIHAAIADCTEDLALAFPGTSILHKSKGTGTCAADIGRLTQLVGNLVGNAVAYGASGSPITVSTTISDDQFVIEVHNHGNPIPHDLRRDLFLPMSRGTSSGAFRSVGLGLFIVAEIVKAHGGTVVVNSDQAHGTSFTATFPSHCAAQADSHNETL